MIPITISPDRLQFMTGDTSFIWRGTLDWPLFGRYLNEGADVVRAVFQDRRSVGANTVCCAGMLSWWPGLRHENPQYWQSLRPFVELAEQEQMRVCFMVFCDTAFLMPGRDEQIAHWARFLTTLGDKTNVTFVGVNQPGHPSQQIDPLVTTKLPQFAQLLCARDNPLESANPVLPAMDFSCYCSSRDEVKGVIEVGSSMSYVVNGWEADRTRWDGTHQVSVLFEGPHFRPNGAWGDPGKARQIARSLCFKGTGGGNFYSDQCSQAALLTDVERACSVEFLGNIPLV